MMQQPGLQLPDPLLEKVTMEDPAIATLSECAPWRVIREIEHRETQHVNLQEFREMSWAFRYQCMRTLVPPLLNQKNMTSSRACSHLPLTRSSNKFDEHEEDMSDLTSNIVKVEAIGSGDFQLTNNMTEGPTVQDLVDRLLRAETATRSPSPQHSISGYSTPGSAWPRSVPPSNHFESPSYLPVPTFGASPDPDNCFNPSGNASSNFDRATDPTVVEITCHHSFVLRKVVADFMQKQVREAGLDNTKFSVEGLASFITFTNKFEGGRNCCCKQVAQLLESPRVDNGVWKHHSVLGADEAPTQSTLTRTRMASESIKKLPSLGFLRNSRNCTPSIGIKLQASRGQAWSRCTGSTELRLRWRTKSLSGLTGNTKSLRSIASITRMWPRMSKRTSVPASMLYGSGPNYPIPPLCLGNICGVGWWNARGLTHNHQPTRRI